MTMPETPQVEPLSYGSRRRFFLLLFLMFALAVPVFVFYATGYRYDFFSESPISKTGGLYVSAEAEDSQIYLDEEEVRSLRVFRNAAYIQSLTPGVHRLHVQAPNLQTWVKVLPVHGQIVTEVAAFNMPERPQIRPVTAYQDQAGAAVYWGIASTSLPFSFASSSLPMVATTTATSSLVLNSEYEFVETLFTSTTTAPGLVGRVLEEMNETFRFASDVSTTTEAATTSLVRNDITLYKQDGEVYAAFTGTDERDIPYYFCIPFGKTASTSDLYGEHVSAAIQLAMVEETRTEAELSESERLCRTQIRLDRKWQTVHWFNFFPNSSDLVLLLLDEGLYVVEIDDRAWQNTQVLYPGRDLEVALNGGQIFVKDGDYYLEVFTELIEL